MVNFSIEANGTTARLAIEGDVTIACAAQFKDSLMEALSSHEQVLIDCTSLQSLDLAGMQLLCAAHRAAANRSKSAVLIGTEQAHIKKLLEDAGFLRHEACSMSDGKQNCLWLDVERMSGA